MKLKTIWKKCNTPYFKDRNKKFFNDEIGWFYVLKIQTCKEYCKFAKTPSGSRWFDKQRVFIKTDTGIKYVVPYIWLVFNSVTERGNLIWKVIDGIVNEDINKGE